MFEKEYLFFTIFLSVQLGAHRTWVVQNANICCPVDPTRDQVGKLRTWGFNDLWLLWLDANEHVRQVYRKMS